MDVLHQRRGDRQQVARQSLHLLGHLERVHPLPDQGLVDVQVEEAHFGLCDLADRLGVHPDQLQHRDQREAGAKHIRDPLHRDQVLIVEGALDRGRRSQQCHDPLDQCFLQAGLLRGVGTGMSALPAGEQVLHIAERQSAVANRPAKLLQRVAALAHPGDDAGLRGRGRGPAPSLDRDHPATSPALEGRRGHARDPRGLAQGDQGLRHRSYI